LAYAVTLRDSHYGDHPVPQSLPPPRCLGQASNYRHPLQPTAAAVVVATIDVASTTVVSLARRNQMAADSPITSSSSPASLAVFVFQLKQPWLPS